MRIADLVTAYALLKQTTRPSWLYSVTHGATTIWERWDGWVILFFKQEPIMTDGMMEILLAEAQIKRKAIES